MFAQGQPGGAAEGGLTLVGNTDAQRNADRPTIEELLNAKHSWYHVIELAPGVVTPGWVDMRPYADRPRLPVDMSGMRALDVGTFDGFWAFTMERRGASVVGIDIDEIPPPDAPVLRRERLREAAAGTKPGTGFHLLQRYFDSSARRVSCNVYDLTPEAIGGRVDIAFLGAFLLHLRNPVGALEAVRSVLEPGGKVVLFEPVDPRLTRRLRKQPVARFRGHESDWNWWEANLAGLVAWLRAAGFQQVRTYGQVWVTDTTKHKHWAATVHASA